MPSTLFELYHCTSDSIRLISNNLREMSNHFAILWERHIKENEHKIQNVKRNLTQNCLWIYSKWWNSSMTLMSPSLHSSNHPLVIVSIASAGVGNFFEFFIKPKFCPAYMKTARFVQATIMAEQKRKWNLKSN